MIIKANIVGQKEVHYTNRDGREVNGRNLYYIFEDVHISGNGADSIYLPDSKYKSEIFANGDTIRVAIGKGYKEFIEKV